MRLLIDAYEYQAILHLEVVKIEVEAVVKPDPGAISQTYDRTIRFTTADGETFEVWCVTREEDALQLRSVNKLPPVKKPKPDQLAWFRPKLYRPRMK
jgi:hypothetical protein